MAADYSTVKSRITEILNACDAGSFSSTIATTNLDRNATAIAEAAREAALLIGRAIVANPSHPHRNAFVSGTATTLTHQGELPDMAGEMDLVEIQPYSSASWQTGQTRDVQQIESFRSNPGTIYDSIAHNITGSRLSGYYAVSNGRVYFTGYAARGYFPLLDRTTITGIIPDEYEGLWICLGVGLSVKEGDNLFQEAQYYMQIGLQDLAAVTTMGVISQLPTPERARKNRGS